MFPIIYAPNSQEFTSHGIGVLVDCLSCEVTEERNGIFEAALTYPVTGHHADAIVGGAIFKAVAHRGDTGQLFEIYEINTDFEGNIEAQARHISYRLGYIPCSPFSAHNVIDAFSYLPSHMIETGGFTFQTANQTNADFQIDIPRSTRAVLGGEEGSFLDVYGGEYEFDNFTVKLHGNRGSDKGVVLRYGKNITDISQEQEISETYTGLYPYYNSDDTYIELPEKVVYCSNAANFAYHRVLILDCSNEFKDEYDDPKVPTETEMRTFAQKYMNDHDFGVPKVSLSVSFDAQGVTDMEYVLLCDTVTVIFPELRVSAKSKVIKTVYDTILGKYKEIELGSPKASFASTLASQISGSAEKSSLELLDTRNHLERAQDELTAKLLGANGGYKVEVTNADGQIIETLYLDNLDPALANHVWRWNINGLGYSSTGINGPYTLGITSDGEIVADFITTGTLDASLITVANLYASAINMNSSMTLDGKISAIDDDISDLNDDITDINGDITTVNSTLTNHQTQITANTNGLATKVSATDYTGNNIVSRINQTATTVSIAASKVNLTGYVTMTNLSTSGQTTINGNNITTGKISSANGRTYFDLANNVICCSLVRAGVPFSVSSGNPGEVFFDIGWEKIQNTWYSRARVYYDGYSSSGLLLWPNKTGGGSVQVPSGGTVGITPQNSSAGCSVKDAMVELTTTNNVLSVEENSGGYSTNQRGIHLWNNTYVESGCTLAVQYKITTQSLTVSGSKSRVVDTDDYNRRLLFCYEMASPMFGDIGESVISEDGLAYIDIDPIFSETARTDIPYQVFLQKNGPGDLWVDERHLEYFIVKGTPGLKFSWELKGKQLGYEAFRMEDESVLDIPEDSSVPNMVEIGKTTDRTAEESLSMEDFYESVDDYLFEQEELLYETVE